MAGFAFRSPLTRKLWSPSVLVVGPPQSMGPLAWSTLIRMKSRTSEVEPKPLNTSTQAVGPSLARLNSAFPLLKFAVAAHNQAFLAAPAAGPHFFSACCMVRWPEMSAGLHFGKRFGLK